MSDFQKCQNKRDKATENVVLFITTLLGMNYSEGIWTYVWNSDWAHYTYVFSEVAESTK